MAKFTSGHGLYYFLPQFYISKRTIFGSKPWLFCELALDWVPDVVPSAPFSPKRAYSRKQKCIRKDPFPVTKKKNDLVHPQSAGTNSRKLFMFCKGTHGRRRQAPWTLQAQTHAPPFYTNVSCSFRLLFKAQEWDSATGQHLLYHVTPSRPFQFLAWASKSSGIVGRKAFWKVKKAELALA